MTSDRARHAHWVSLARRALGTVAWVGTAAILGAPQSLQAQQPTPGAWTFLARANVDLWYHGVATVGYEGFAPVPLYDRGYAGRTERLKRAAGVFPTSLDTLAGGLRAGFSQDSTFEVLHFLPLYFGLSDVGEMLDAIERVAEGGEPTDFGSGIVASVFRSRSQRRLLVRFVAALRVEWETFYRAYWTESRTQRTRALGEAQRLWGQELAPVLQRFLDTRGLAGGVVVASEAVGQEGRVFSGDPSDPSDNMAAVMLDPEAGADAALLLVRELCYPLVSQAVERLHLGAGDRVFAERMSSRASVRCGAMLLERHASRYAEPYRRLFLGAVGETDSSTETFERMFQVDEALLGELEAGVAGR